MRGGYDGMCERLSGLNVPSHRRATTNAEHGTMLAARPGGLGGSSEMVTSTGLVQQTDQIAASAIYPYSLGGPCSVAIQFSLT